MSPTSGVNAVGEDEGEIVGSGDGILEGSDVGAPDQDTEGAKDRVADGVVEGWEDGTWVGVVEGMPLNDGLVDGMLVEPQPSSIATSNKIWVSLASTVA